MISALSRLTRTEARLFVREPVSLVLAFVFPALTVLVLGGVFEPDDPAFGGATPSDYYIAAYFGVVLAAVGFIMLPVHLASYRERGVLRRFHASFFPPWALPAAWVVVAAALSTIGFLVLLGTSAAVFGVPTVDDPVTTAGGIVLAVCMYSAIGIVLGLALPTARAAQGVGMTLFFLSFLLGGAGPPPDVMPPVMGTISSALPMTHAVQAIQHSWLSIGDGSGSHLLAVAVVLLAAASGSVVLAARTSRS